MPACILAAPRPGFIKSAIAILIYAHLEQLLQKHADSDQPKFILTESVFSMDGDVADMARLGQLAKQYECLLVCDDAHGTGILGDKGAGLSGSCRSGDRHFFQGPWQAFGAFLGRIGADARLYHQPMRRLHLFNGPAPFCTWGHGRGPDPVALYGQRARPCGKVSGELSRRTEGPRHPLSALPQPRSYRSYLRSSDRVLNVSDKLKKAGIWATAIRPPTVSRGEARLRITFTVAHRQDDLEKLLTALDIAMKTI